jgi:hypothetical protein
MNLTNTLKGLTLACSIVLLAGCGGGSDSTTTSTGLIPVTPVTTVSTGTTTTPVTTTTPAARLTPAETETLLFVREEEKMARDVYLTLYNKWGTKVFQNIATRSEQTHMDVMGGLINTYGLVDPVLDNTVGAFTDPAILALYQDLVMQGSFSLLDGLKVGGFVEEFDINDLQEAIAEAKAGSNPADIIRAYDNLMCGSRNHLRAFVSQYENNGVDYVAQVMPQAAVDAIVATPEEQCGQ